MYEYNSTAQGIMQLIALSLCNEDALSCAFTAVFYFTYLH